MEFQGKRVFLLQDEETGRTTIALVPKNMVQAFLKRKDEILESCKDDKTIVEDCDTASNSSTSSIEDLFIQQMRETIDKVIFRAKFQRMEREKIQNKDSQMEDADEIFGLSAFD